MKISYFISKLIKKIQISAVKQSNLHKTSKISSKSHLVNVNMGKYSYIGSCCTILNANIGSFCSIADNVIIGGAAHPIDWVSSSPVFHEGKNILKKNFSNHKVNGSKPIVIGNDVWIGNNALIKTGVQISDGAVIGMGAVITKNVGPYEVWAGNPARKIRNRFDDKTISRLNDIKWWDFNDRVICEMSDVMNKPQDFLEKIEGLKDENITLG